jgi:two-component system, cell cycle response regulator
MKLLSNKQVIIRIAAIIAAAELVIMLTLIWISYNWNQFTEAILDVILLVTLSTPLIYRWVINPFVRARDEAIEQVRSLAFTDPLTQLANRRHILDHLHRMMASSKRHKTYGAILMIDLDGFKQVNDSYGHDAGDAVLIEIAKRFSNTLRSEDLIGRMGGDEFVILIDHIDENEQLAQNRVLNIADKLINQASTAIEYQSKLLKIGASIGITLLDDRLNLVDDALNRADIAMYQAKKKGKGCAVVG